MKLGFIGVGLAQGTYQAQLLERSGQFEQALTAYQQVLLHSPQDPLALAGFIRMCRQLKRFDSLLVILSRLEKEKGERPELTLGIIEGLLGVKRRTEALTRARAFTQKHQEKIMELIEVLKQNGEIAGAAALLEEAVKLADSSSPPLPGRVRIDYWERLIELYEIQGNTVRATQKIVEIANSQPELLPRYLERLKSYAKGTEGARVVNELGKITDKRSKARAQAEVYLALGEEVQAVKVAKEAFSPQELMLFADECEKKGALRAALTIYEEQGAKTYAARILRQLGRLQEALAILQGDSSPMAIFETAELYRLERRDFTKAADFYSRVLRSRPQDPAVLMGLTSSLIGLKQLDSARQVIEKIRRMDDRALFLLIKILFYQGKFDSIPRVVKELSHRFPQSPLVNDGLELGLLSMSGERAKSFALAMLEYEAGKVSEGIKRTKELTQGEDIVAQQAFFLLSRLLFQEGKYQAALAVLDSFLVRFPTSELAAKAKLRQAEIYRDGLNDEARFRAVLEQLLVDFPGSPYLPIARNMLQSALREVKPGEMR
ncbi:MAG: tetratricopeptide repeat protein [candidate division WOR-3 bacterium]